MDASIVVRLIDETRSGFSDINRNLNTVKGTASNLNNTMQGLAAATGAFVSALGVREILNFTNSIQSLDNRLKLVTNSTEELNKVYGDLFRVAQDTRQPLDGTIQLYGRLALASEQLGLSTDQLSQLTSNFNKALSIGGATTAEAGSAMIQFSQALTSGKVEMQELRPLLDSAPVLMRELAKSLGLTQGEFRKFVSEGQITSEMLAKGLLVATERLDEQFGRTATTVGQATNQMVNSFQKLAKEFLESSGASEIMVDGIRLLEKNLLPVTIALGSFAAALAIGSLIQVVTFALGGLTVAVKALTTALVFLGGTPMGRVVSLLGLAAGALVAFSGNAEAADKGTQDLSKSQSDLSKNVGLGNQELSQMEKELQAQVQAMKGANSELAKFNEKLKQEIELAGLDSEEKKKQQLMYEGFKAQAKDLKKNVEQLTEAERAAVRQAVEGAIATINAKNQEAETRRKTFKEATDLLNRFAEDSRKSQNQTLTETEKFTNDLFDIETAYQNAMLNSRGKSREELLKIERDYMDAVKGVHMRGLNDLVREYDKYTTQTKSRTEQFQSEKAKIEEAYQIAMRNSHNMNLDEQREAYEKYQRAIQGLQNKYGQELKRQAEDFRNSELTSTQKHQKRMQELDTEYYELGTISHQDYLALRRKAEKEYVEEAVREYSNLYGLLNEKLLEWSGLSQKEYGIVRDTFKLVFGVDIEDLVKHFFASAIRYVLGFRTSATGDLNGIGGVISNLFGSSGTGIQDVSVFSKEGQGILGGFGSAADNIFSGIGGIISSVFSGGLDFIGNFVRKGLELLGGFGRGAGDLLGSIFDGIGSIFGGGGGGGGDIFGSILDIGGDLLGSIGGGIGDIFGGIGDFLGIGDLVSGGMDILGSIGDSLGLTDILGSIGDSLGLTDLLGSIGSGIGSLFGSSGGGAIGGLLGGAGSILGALGPIGAGIGLVTGFADIFSFLFDDDDYAEKNNAQVQNARSTQASQSQQRNEVFTKLAQDYSVGFMPGDILQVKDRNSGQLLFNRKVNRQGILGAYPGLRDNQAYIAYAASGRTDFGANGLVFDSGNVMKYALGGLITRPTMFGTSTGVAIAGEAGTEAIMPLSRGSNGELGVNAEGMGDVNISFTINAIDAQGVDQLLIERKQLITNMVANAVRQKGRSFA